MDTILSEGHPPGSAPERVAIVGPGRLGCSLGRAVSEAGLQLGTVFYHSQEGRRRAQKWLPGVSAVWLGELTEPIQASAVFLTVRDDVIVEVAERIGPYLRKDCLLWHTSGRLDSQIFDGCELGCKVGSWHPLQSFSNPSSEARFKGCFVALEGDPETVATATAIAQVLGSRPIVVPGDKRAYHAAAVVASNYLVALSSLALRLCDIAGIDQTTAIEMLRPLQLGALDNLREVGPVQALTGPIARGDVETIESHLCQFQEHLPQFCAPYVELGRLSVDLARQQDDGLADRLDAILALFDENDV